MPAARTPARAHRDPQESGTLTEDRRLFISSIAFAGDAAGALRFLTEALAIRRELEDCEGEGKMLLRIGEEHSDLGHKKIARKYYKQAVDVSGKRGTAVAPPSP